MLIRLLSILIFLSLNFCCAEQADYLKKPIRIDKNILKTGDVIFRMGVSPESLAISKMSNNSRYSHAGIVIKQNNSVQVIHIVPYEEGDNIDTLRAEPLEIFLLPNRASAAAIYRLKNQDEFPTAEITRALEKYMSDKIPFDDSFDLETDNRLYCTELVWKIFLQKNIDLLDGKFDNLSLLLGNDKYILPDSLTKSPYLYLVWESK